MIRGNFVSKAVEVGTVSVAVYFNDEDIATLYENEPDPVKRLVEANIVTNDELESYLREQGHNPVNEMVQEENARLKREEEKWLEANSRLCQENATLECNLVEMMEALKEIRKILKNAGMLPMFPTGGE